jgi:hypothetical protein
MQTICNNNCCLEQSYALLTYKILNLAKVIVIINSSNNHFDAVTSELIFNDEQFNQVIKVSIIILGTNQMPVCLLTLYTEIYTTLLFWYSYQNA